MRSFKTVFFGIFAIVVGIILLLQFVDDTVEEIAFGGSSLLLEPYDGQLSTTEVNYSIGTPISELPEPTMDGHIFIGWYTDEEFTEAVEPGDVIHRRTILYAKYQLIDFMLQFVDGSRVLFEDEYGVGDEIILPDEPTKMGYSFGGWYLDEGTTMLFNLTTMPNEDIVVYSAWNINQYTITFDSNGGNALESITQEFNSQITQPDFPTKEGYSFEGWFIDSELLIEYFFPTMPGEDVLLYAKWSINQYEINFIENGGSEVENIIDDFNKVVEAPVSPTKVGHTFAGWYLDELLVEEYTFSTIPANDISLYAKWLVNPYTITFNSNGGSDVSSITQEYNTNLTLPENPVKSGYNFGGWYIDDESNNAFISTTMLSENITLNARWIANEYKIEYVNHDGVVIQTENFTYNSDITGVTVPSDPTRVGYEFTGWSDVLPSSMPSENIQIIAEYSINNYTIEYYDYDGTLLQTETFEFGIDLDIANVPINPSRVGYTFIGWDILVPENMPAQNLIITAVYTINTYSLIFLDDDNTVLDTLDFEYGADLLAVTGPTVPDRVGYMFDGWDVTLPTVMPANDITFKALYSILKYTITFDTNGGSLINPLLSQEGQGISAPIDPTKTGYVFAGWYADQSFDTPFVFLTTPPRDITIFAKWVADTFVVEYQDFDGNVLQATSFDFEADLSGLTSPANPTRVGYTFFGWDSLVPATMPANDVIIKATYTVNSFTIEYQDYNGIVIQTTDYEFGEDLSGVVAPLDPTRVGYTFTGWSDVLPSSMPSNDITITATYTINQYTIIFNSNGGSLISSITDDYDTNISAPVNPTRAGYTFAGWFSDAGLTNLYTISTMPANNISLYAKWTVNQYTITFNTNGGSLIDSIIQDYGTSVVSPSDPTKVGHTFTGWNILVPTVMPANDVSITAIYSTNTYTLEYQDYDGAVIQTASYSYANDLSGVISPSDPTRTGYTFNGWNLSTPAIMPANDVIITATYTPNTYSLTYKNYNGTILQSTTYSFGADLSGVIAPEPDLKTGYTFTGWNLALPATMPAINLIIIPTFTINQYTITFNSNGGSSVSSITEDYNTVLVAPTTTRIGYTFAGWFSDAGLTNAYTLTTMPANDFALYGKWIINQYTINFDTDGGSLINSIYQDYDTAVIAPSNPTKAGYTFAGWDILIPSTMPANDLTITATYTINSYTLEYQDYDGTVIQADSFDFNDDLSGVIAPVEPSRIGYTFAGWDISIPVNMPASDVIITATYVVDSYTLEYQDYDGTVLQTGTYNYGANLSSVNAPSDPTRIGYTFNNWDSIIPVTMPVNDVTITATYIINQYTITFNSNGGSSVSSITENYNTVLVSPADPTRTGYTFAGWFSDAGLTNAYTFTAMPASNISLYAKWNINQYTITFDSNSGSSVTAITQDYATNVLAPTNPIRSGYAFGGWFSDAGLTTPYIFTTMPSENITLYADWVVSSFTLAFKDYDGTVLQSGSYDFDEDLSGVAAPLDPTRTGYTFAGWNILTPATMPASNITIIATYTVNSYTIEYQDHDGTLLQADTFNYDANITSVLPPVEPSRSGYTFNGWDISLPTNMPANNIVIIATYIINSYALEFQDYDGSVLQTTSYEFNEDLSGVTAPADPTRTGYTFSGWDIVVPANMLASNVIITATYTVNSYTLEFQDYDGSVLQTASYEFNEDLSGVTAPADPSRSGYTFGGWDISVPATMPANDVTITAEYSINSYTLEYVDWDGTVLQTALYEFNEDLSGVTPPIDPSRIGYTFNVWDSTSPGVMPAADVTITATYTVNSYTLEYQDYNGAVLQSESYNFNSDLTGVTAPVDPTRTGYTFNGWDTLLPSTMPANDLTITATYTINQYTITFVSNGGSSVNPITQNYNTVVVEPADPTRTGHTFAGWYSDAGLTTAYTFSTMPANNISLYAKWDINQYTITFDSNGGSAVSAITQDYSTSVIEPSDPIKTGYTFDAWYSDAGLTTPYSFTTMPASNITIYAKWIVNSYTLTYEDYDGTLLKTASYDFGEDLSGVIAPVNPTRTGYSFSGWDTLVPATMPASNVTITATYTVNSYTLEYVDWDSALLQTASYNYGADLSGVIAPIDPTRTGYTFAGWDSAVPATMPDNNITITATYTINQYTITFDSNGGSSVSAITQNYNTVVTEPTDPTKTGYTFDAWYSDAGLTTPYTFTTMPAEDTTIYAKWIANQYTITFDSNGGTAVTAITQDFNSSVSEPSDPTRTGYSFDAWYSDAGLTTPYAFTTMPAENISVYAKWIVNQYTLEYQDHNGSVLQTELFNFGADLSGVTPPAEPSRTGYTFASWDSTAPATMPASTVTITATYIINSYTLEYQDYNGSVLQTTSYDYNDDLSGVTAPTDPTRIGYTFSGWDTVIPSTMPENDLTITASYTINQYTILFNSNGGSSLTPITQDYNSSVSEPSNPTKTGYTFVGWYSDAELTIFYAFTTMPAENITVYAKWNINQYTITFASNGGSSVTAITQDYNTSVIEPAEPTRSGYTFDTWYSDAGLTTPYTFTTMSSSNITLYAKWIVNSYTLTYEDYDGTVLQTASYDFGTDLSIVTAPSSPTRTGYIFSGWDISKPSTMPANDVTITATYSVNSYTLEFVDYNSNVLQTADYNYGVDLSGVTSPSNPTRTGYTFDSWDISVPATMPANDVTITATYSINQYTITFHSNGGSSVTAITQDFNTSVSAPSDPTRTGYSFGGWYSDATLINSYSFTTMPSSDISLYAKWIINQYTITFVSNGGSSVTAITQDYNTSVIEPTEPTRTGYTFDTWCSDAGLTTPYTFTTMPSSNTTIYAKWTVISYTLAYEDYDGSLLQSASYDFGTDLSTVSAPSSPTRTGYSFNGWDIVKPSTMPANDVTITATYLVNSYTLAYKDWDGSVLQTANYNYGANLSSVTPPADPTRTGYTFSSWDSTAPATMPASNVTVNATYSINQYTITFDSNGGSSVSPITQNYNTAVSAPANPTKTGYTFGGWYSDAGLTSSYSFTTMPANNITIYAKWNVNQYTISFSSNGGTAVTAITQDYNTSVSAPTEPTKTSYIFGGWYSDAGLTSEYSFDTMPASNITLYAKWNSSLYTMTFDSNGGTAVGSITQTAGTAVAQPTDPTRTGYTFVDWYSDPGLTSSYTFTTMPSNNITLYAKWTVNSSTITFNSNGGSSVTAITQNYGTSVTEPSEPTKSGYIFDDWYSDIGLTTPYVFTTMPASSITIYAKWITDNSTISFNSNGGTAVSDITQQAATSVSEPADPTKTGYTFDAWYSDYALTSAYTFTTMPTDDITLYAKWIINSYTVEYLDWDSSVLQTADYNYGADLSGVTAPSNPTRTGYTFSGWDSTVPATMPASTVTITAEYTVNSYTLEYVDYDGTVLQTADYNYGVDLSAVSAPGNPTRTGYTFDVWDTSKPATMPASDVTITATYTINQYTITFDSNGGSSVSPITQDYNTLVLEPAEPTRTGYTFSGWYSDIGLTSAYTFTTIPAENITVYAKWTVNQYTITFNSNGGTAVSAITQDYNSSVSEPADPTKTGYTFDAWYSDSGLTTPYTFTTMPANSFTVYAKWTVNSYTLAYEDWDGTVLQTASYNYGSDLSGVTAPSDPTRTGYTFTGWDLSLPATMPANAITITAEYTINSYTLAYEDYDGTVLQTADYNYGADLSGVTPPIDPTRSGYTFDVWNSTAPATMPANDVTITATYTINQYTITFDSNGGTAVTAITQDYDTAVSSPANPTKTGYTFGGWHSDVGLTTPYTFTTMPAENITVYAKWDVNQYTITFNSNGGTAVTALTQDFGTAVAEPTDPTRSGYSFDAWYSDAGLTTPYAFTTMPAENITIYAKWIVNSYTLAFEDWDGTVLQTANFNYGSDLSGVTAPSEPTRTGYTFDSWDSTVPATMPASDVTITATYTINTYTLEYVDWDGTVLQTADYNFGADLSAVTPPIDPTRTGYTFDAWDSTAPATMPANDITITATYTINQYTITFNSNGGSSVTAITQDYGTAVTEPAEPTRTGYTFDAWQSDVGLTTPYTFTTMPAENITVYAKWIVNSYTLTYEDHNGTELQSASYNFGADLSGVTAPSEPTRTGYTFDSWDSTVPATMPANDVTITATYTINTYTLEYVDWDGTVLQTADYNYESDLSAVTAPVDPTRTGYTFASWDSLVPTTMPASDVTITATYTINTYTLEYVDWDGTVLQTADYNFEADLSGVTAPANPTRTGYTFDSWDSLVPATMPASDVTITATYTINQYTITFDSNGGTAVTAITQDYNTSVSSPANPTRVGYTFSDWYSDAGLTTPYSFTTMPAENITVYAKWNINQYTITFNSNGGSSVTAITQDYDSAVTEPADPIRTGYTFAAWYSDAGLTTPYTFTTMPAENITVYAKWIVNSYTLAYEDWDGTILQTASYNFGSDLSGVTAPVDPTRIGYTFSGWDISLPATMPASDVTITATYTINTYTLEYVDWDGTVLQTADYNFEADLSGVTAPANPTRTGYTFDSWDTVVPATMPASDVTITATYTINQYTITFDSNGGSVVTAITQDYGTVVTEPADPTRTGYTFSAWYSDAGLTTPYTFTTMPAENITVYAKWNINQYTITFNSNGGTAVSAITQDYGTVVTEPADPTKTGYIFDAWYSDAGLTTPYIFTTMPAENITVYANWTTDKYTIQYLDWDSTVLQTGLYDYGEDISGVTAPADPSRVGYTFSGWDTVLPSTMPSNNITVTATYTVNSYTLEFVDWDGTVLQTAIYDFGADLLGVIPPANPARTGYTFSGWDDAAPETMPANDVTITATFTINQYTITFDSNGGTAVIAITQDYNTSVTQPSDPTKTGYTFSGWYSDAGLTTPYTFTTMPAENITVYAKWNINQYTITFNSNGGSSVSAITQDYGTVVTEPADPTKTGYTFDAWYSDAGLTTPYIFTTMPAENITVYAKWIVNTYTLAYEDWDGTVLQTASYNFGADLSGVTAPTDPTRSGYTFSGWDSTVPATMPASDVTITATYIINTYTLEYVDWDGTVLQTADYNFGADLSGVTAPVDPTRIGYTFSGWDSIVPATMPANDVTITATYTINQYTITFDSNGGTAVTAITQDYGTAVTQPSDPTRTGYTFSGWYSDAGLTTPYTFTTMPAENITVYARWNINQYTITFNSNGGTAVTAITQDYGTAVTEPVDPTKIGYTFDAWYSDLGLTTPYTFTTMPAENITVYAKWIVNSYTLAYEDWDGTVLQTATYNFGADLSGVTAPTDPTRTGYTFTGWDTLVPATMPASDVTITATYTINTYTLEYVDWDGTVLQTADYNYGSDLSGVTAPTDPTRIGYTFSGWDSVVPATMPANDVTITATYTINQYTITFDSNGGTAVTAITQDYGTAVTQPADPTRSGFTFGGWYSDAGLTTPYTFTTMPAENITVYAAWSPILYTITYKDFDGTTLQTSSHEFGADLSGVTAPADPTRVGYTFVGWDSVLPATMPASNIIITATYTINTYTLEYVDWDGTILQTATYNFGADLSGVIAPTDPTRIGYTFTGWDTLVPATMPASDVTITATYTINQYTITFDSNGGTAITAITQDYGTIVTQPIDPTKVGFTFAGWYSDIGLITPYTFTTMPANNITVYAKWTVVQYTITFDSNGGTAVAPITAQEGTAITAPADPTKTGFIFAGWYTDNTTFTNQFTFTTMPPLNLTLYARWLDDAGLAQFVADEIQTQIDNGLYQNIDVANKSTTTMEAGILAVTADLQATYPTAIITLINGTRSGSTYTFTFQIVVNASTVTIQTVVATFV
ncbi:InlB B-repeat-containing protein [Mycoplasmatota bacterium WC30]